MKQAPSTKQKQQVPQYVGITPAGNQHQLSKNQFNLLHGNQQQNSFSQSHANQLSATGPQGSQVAGQQNGRSASSGTNYNHKSAKSQIQPVFAMKNRKVKNASYSQQRTDRIDKPPSQSQVNFGSQGGLQGSQNYHNVQMSQNLGGMGRDLGGSMSQFDSGNMPLAGGQPLLASTVQVGTQGPVHQQIQHQYNSTQPAPGSHSGPGFAMSQSYQSLQNTKLKNQKNYQAKVQKARRLGSSHGTTNGQNQPQTKANQVATGTQSLLNFQQMPNSQSQLNNKTAMFQNYKTNVAPATTQNTMMSSSNPPSAGNSRSKSVHQQAQQNPNVYGLNNGMAASQPGNPSSSKMIETNHSSTKSHQFTNTNPIAVDPYAQSPQINFNYPQNVPIIKHPKTVKQQRSLSDQFGGRRQQQQHNVSLKQMEQAQGKKVNKQQVPSHPQIGGQLSKSNFANTNQLNSISQINQIPISTASKRMNNSQAADSTNAHNQQSGSAQSNTGGNQAATTAQTQNSNKSQKAAVGAQKMISLNAKLQGIYKQYKTVSGSANQAGPNQSGDNALSPKDFGFLTQPSNNQKQAQNNAHSQAQKQLSQTGQIQYNSGGSHPLHHEGGRNMQNRLMSYQPSAYSSAQQKAMDGIQKNAVIRERSPGGSAAGQSQSLSNMQAGYQGSQNPTKIGGHNLKSQSMHQIPQTQTQQLYQSNKFHHFGPSMSQANFPGPLDGHADHQAKRQQQAKLGQVHSVAHLGQGDSNQQTVRVPSGKRPESLGALEGGREQARANMSQQQLHHQRQGTPSNKHRRMSPKIQGLDGHAQVDLLTQNTRSSHNANQGQGLRVGSQDFHNNVSGTHQGYNSQPFGSYQGQRHPSQDSKAQASAAPASGVNSNLSQFGTAPLMERQAQVNSYMDAKSLVGVVNAKTDGSGGLSQSIKQIPIRQVKVRNQAGSFVEASRSFNLSLKDSQALGKYEKAPTGESMTNYHHRGQSHQNGADIRPDSKPITDTQSKQGYHQRKEARIPSAGKKRTASGQGLTLTKRVPSAQRLKQHIHDQQKQSNTTKQAQEDRKKDIADIKEELSGNNGAGNVFKPRSSITNVRRSRNEGKVHPPDNHGSDMLNTADNPTSAGQSTSSLYKQEQINKKFKFQEAPQNDGPKPDLAPKEDKSQEMPKPLNNIDFEDHSKPSKEQTKGTTPTKDMKRSKSKGMFDKEAANAAENTKDKDQDKQQDADVGANPAGKDKKGMFSVAPTAGLSGRNLYFNQIRNEINLSESGKCKGLPDYQNAKYSNKRNGLVAGYGANTNQGIVRNYNEDRVAIILNIMKPKSKNYESQQWPKCSFFGIYDGHGGAVCADFLRDYLHQFIIKDENFPQNPIQALRNGFREAERLFMEFAESQEKEAGEIDRSGSCAVVILIIDDMCYCANTGDSRAIMSADGGEKLFLLSTDHKPTDEIEMKRIIEQGGRIYQNSQVIQTNPTLGEGGKQMVYGPHRVFPGRLSVSRTIGDIEAKIEKYEGNANVVIADPDVTAFEIKDNHDFIVIGCDGVFDKLSSKDAIHIAWQKVLMEAAKANVEKVDLQQTHQNCGHCVDGILRTSALRRTVDNVTCVVVAFDGFQRQLQKFISNNQDGTTVDVIEEIQLEPIPEYLSNTKMNQPNKKSTGPSDNSMLLLDDNQTFSESENPLIGGKNLRGPNRAADGVAAKKNAGSGPDNKLLSEIAEEDDVSSVSENAANKLGSNNKVHDGPLGRAGKGSIHSITDQSLRDADQDPASLTERDAQKDKAQMEQKRRSQIIPQHSAGRVSSNAGANEAMLKTKQNASSLESRLLDDVEVAVNVPRRQNKGS